MKLHANSIMRVYLRITLLLLVYMTSRAASWSWTPVSTAGPHVSGHSAATAGDRVWLFGGLTGAAGSPVTDDLWSYTTTAGWNLEPATRKGGPGRRMYAASAILNGSFYVFGGWDPGEKGSGGTFKDDAWRLDLATMEWHQEDPMPCGPVSRHTACTVGTSIIIHTFRGIFSYCNGKLTEQTTTGDGPEVLSMCAAVSLGDDTMFLFGGSTKTQALSEASFVLDTTTWTWRKLASKAGPGPRASSCGAPVDTNRCVIFGGASLGQGGYEGGAGLVAQDETWLVTVKGDTAEWEKLDKGPEGRVAATLSPLPSGGFVLQGGWDPASKGTYNKPWLLER
jgi:Kelch motif/Galactose oxidase, central domain